MIKVFIKFSIFFSISISMLFLSSELSKISRDYARIVNAHTLSKSIQYYKITYGFFPESGYSRDIASLLYEEQILFDIMTDPLSISSTIKIDKVIDDINFSYAKVVSLLNKDTFSLNYNKLKTKVLKFYNLTHNEPSLNPDTLNFNDNNLEPLILIDSLSNFPADCVIVYKADNTTNSYEISMCLESDFFKNKKKWDGGNDDLRLEIGSDLRLNTEIVVRENGKITSSENSSIFK